MKRYYIRFGSAFSIDQFGFVRKGEIAVNEKTITFSGNRHWPLWRRCFAFLVIMIVPGALFGVTGFLPFAAVFVHYSCTSHATVTIQKATVTELKRKRRRIKFKAEEPSCGKHRKTVFKVDCEKKAAELEKQIENHR